MNKKILTTFIIFMFSITTLPISKAEDIKLPTLAILDTALNSNMPEIKNNIVYEVCLLDWQSCPNKTQFQEGPGAAKLPLNQISINGFDHGTMMVSSAIQTNPNIKILFIRIVGINKDGTRQVANETSLINALTWIYINKDRFNIKAISMSQGHHGLDPGTNYCPKNIAAESIINKLIDSGVQLFFSAGNQNDLKKIDWPACISSSFSVSASTSEGNLASYTNYDTNLTDIFANGDMKVLLPSGKKINVNGTSISTQVVAATYIALVKKYPTYTSQELIHLLKLKTIPLVNKNIQNGKILNVSEALNG